MARPIYFLPDVAQEQLLIDGKWNEELLRARGLWEQLGDLRAPQNSCAISYLRHKTPLDDRPGCTVQVTGEAPPRLSGYVPKEQQWHLRPAGFDVAVGLDPQEPVTPADLARSASPRHAGYSVLLGDGQAWEVPILRSPYKREELGRSDLPCDWIYGEDGQPKKEIVQRYRELWDLSGKAWDHWFNREAYPTVDLDVLLEIGVGALGLNYRFGKIEQTVLRLLSSENWEEFVGAILDTPFAIDLMKDSKKNEP